MKPIMAIAATTVGEAIRRRVLLVILLVGLFFVMAAPGLSVLSARQELTVLKSLVLGVIQLTSAVIAIVLTVYMLPNEIERRTIYTILSKPVLRWQFLVGKYLGAVAALGIMMSLMTVVMLIMFVVQVQVRDFSKLSELVQGPAMFFIQMSLLAAVGIFFSTFVSPLVNFFLTGGIYMMGSLFNPMFETMASNPGTTPFAKNAASLVNAVLPNFADFNIQNRIINPESVIQNPLVHYMNLTVYGVFYIAVLLIAGILVFDRREV
jgi:ABC-type transport system involved in multi-copper enzyme maturation permease subunit